MANPQAEDGYTKIANEIMEALARIRIPGEARQVLDVILRKTYGWGKKKDRIALSQFYESTGGMKKPSISRAIKMLLAIKLITVSEKANRNGQEYEFNKDYETWNPLAKKLTLAITLKGVSEKANAVSNKAKNRLQKSLPQKKKETITKETITKESIESIISHLNIRTGKTFRLMDKTKNLIKARFNEGFNIENFFTVIDNQTVKWLKDPKMMEYLRPETLFGTKFESYLNAPPTAAQAGIVTPGAAGAIGWAEREEEREKLRGQDDKQRQETL